MSFCTEVVSCLSLCISQAWCVNAGVVVVVRGASLRPPTLSKARVYKMLAEIRQLRAWLQRVLLSRVGGEVKCQFTQARPPGHAPAVTQARKVRLRVHWIDAARQLDRAAIVPRWTAVELGDKRPPIFQADANWTARPTTLWSF